MTMTSKSSVISMGHILLEQQGHGVIFLNGVPLTIVAILGID